MNIPEATRDHRPGTVRCSGADVCGYKCFHALWHIPDTLEGCQGQLCPNLLNEHGRKVKVRCEK